MEQIFDLDGKMYTISLDSDMIVEMVRDWAGEDIARVVEELQRQVESVADLETSIAKYEEGVENLGGDSQDKANELDSMMDKVQEIVECKSMKGRKELMKELEVKAKELDEWLEEDMFQWFIYI